MKSSKTVGAGGLWGELPIRETHNQEVITPDIIENVWRQVMDESTNSDCDYQMVRQPEFIQLVYQYTNFLKIPFAVQNYIEVTTSICLQNAAGKSTCSEHNKPAAAAEKDGNFSILFVKYENMKCLLK